MRTRERADDVGALAPQLFEVSPNMSNIIVLNNQARVIHCGGIVMLTTGTNEVDADAWDQCMKIPVIASMVDAGLIEPKSVSNIDKLKPEEARRVIRETYSLDPLNRWRVGETRKSVVEAIDAQIASVSDAIAKAAAANEENQKV